MAKKIFIIESVAAPGLKIEFRPLPNSDMHPAGYAWGELSLWLGGTLTWYLENNGVKSPAPWTWVEFLEGIGRIWPWLTLEESYPIPIFPEHPGRINFELLKRWETMDESQRDDEEDLMFDFNHRHNLSLLLRGLNLPPLVAIREGNEMVLWSPSHEKPVRMMLLDFLQVLNSFGDYLAELLKDSNAGIANLAVKRWNERLQKSIEMKHTETFGIIDPKVVALINKARNANDDIYADNEIRAAARMTAKTITAQDQILILETINNIKRRETPFLDEVSAQAPNIDAFGLRAYEQGYELALWLRDFLGTGTEKANPADILEQWNIEIIDISMDPEICAVAVWGKNHGPSIIINSKSPARSSGAKGRRATLAHEICHLIYDRNRSLPVADVLGGLGPKFAEQRANAFAAEFLLPRSIACQEIMNSTETVTEAAKRLERKYGASREIVLNQISNSHAYHYLSEHQIIELQSWVRKNPGFTVADD